jgi:hypothetical protein
MNTLSSHQPEGAPSSVDDVREKLLEQVDTHDVLGPLRLAHTNQHELLVGNNRVLIMPQADYLPYEDHFTRAEIPKLERDEELDFGSTIAVVVPRDARTISQIWNVHETSRGILAGVFRMAGQMVDTLGQRTGEIPDVDGFRLNRIITIRNTGRVTMLPPVEFVDDSEDTRDAILDAIAKDLKSLRDSDSEEQYKQKFKEGLKNVSGNTN